MSRQLVLLRLFFTPFNGWPWLFYIGLGALLVIVLIGFFFPRVGFGLAVWDYTILFAIPFTLAPKVLRTLLSNPRLTLVPGTQRQIILALLVFTLAQTSFIPFFALWYGGYASGVELLRNASQLFIASSVYILVMQYAVTTRWAVAVLSLFPMLLVGAVLYTMQGKGQNLLQDSTLAALLLLTLCGWMVAWLYTGNHHRFSREHESVFNYKSLNFQNQPLMPWLFNGGNALAAPDATLLLGYPANLMTRARVAVYMVFAGPLIATVMLTLVGFGREWENSPSMLELFIASSVFPATFGSFQNIEWVARLRSIWLRRHVLRHQLWQFLEKQMAINLALLLSAALALTGAGLLFSSFPADLMLHFPLLVLLFNLFYGYYIICSRTSPWPSLHGILASAVGSMLLAAALWVALKFDSSGLLYALEAVVALAALSLRHLARSKLSRVDWLIVKPAPTPTVMSI